MAIAHDNTTTATTGFASSLTVSHATSGSDKILLTGVGIRASNITATATHNGSAMTLLMEQIDATFGTRQILFYIKTPNATGDVVVTVSSAVAFCIVNNSYTGIDQTSTFGTDVGIDGQATSSTINLSSASGELCVDVMHIRDTEAMSITGGQTLRGNANNGSNTNVSMSEEAGAASVDMSWSWTTSLGSGQIGVPLKPSGEAPTGIPIFRRRIEGY